MPNTQLWLIRHGETAWNAERRFQGHTDIPLNPNGAQQAKKLAERLIHQHSQQAFAAIYSSDLSRARHTAEPTSLAIKLPMRLDARLRERHYGVLSTLTPEEMAVEHPETFRRWQRRDPAYVLPRGESLNQFNQRVMNALSTIAREHAGRSVIVMAHGGVLDCAYRAAHGMALSEPRKYTLHNASINRMRFAANQFHIERWGDITHLDAEAFDEQ
ncbi:histidine phosphatase family protein [Chitinimonas sp. BJB300]|uniref:histidine phosphatase family protein n=1 Tax=Chitinimonas sp. BJB300 TaxID=1559339 RepID=UPI000C0E170C|nr:histidine phosphatase family protein [Chitinimonas sp. BJB300]PHV11625.1 histidine phosphatase family protein [Chitinimonas sp. BJB300]TSJ85580.1 histidine phosphatase family protein [Chitinimonas sp. BJB300]